MEKEKTVSSLNKALQVLDCFAEESQLGATQISRRLGMSKGYASKILSTLCQEGYIDKNYETKKYELGMHIFALSRALGEKYVITKVASPYLQELANIIRQRVYLAMQYRNKVLYLDAFYPIGEIGLIRNILGEEAELYCTGIGKAILSNMPPHELERYCSHLIFQQYTDKTLMSESALRQDIEKSRQRGYAIDDMEHEFGIRCLAMPILSRSRRTVAAVSISGSSLNITNDKMDILAQHLKKTVQEIEGRL